jgi:hypothetical protein
MTRHGCGCETQIDQRCGASFSVTKCEAHRAAQRDPATIDAAYYEELGLIRGGIVQTTQHVAELTDAIGGFDKAQPGAVAVEIGGGVTPYAGAIQAAGYRYLGVEMSHWAAEWARSTFDVEVIQESLDQVHGITCDLMLAAHCLEHMPDAIASLNKMAEMLKPGCPLFLIIPDDSDMTNPDHLWFFNESTITNAIAQAGLVIEKIVTKRIVKHENFIYAKARKRT